MKAALFVLAFFALIACALAVRPRVFFDFEVDGKAAGRITMELYDDIVPKTAANFLQLSTTGVESNGKVLSYNGVPAHRIIDGFMLQSGDITTGNGMGGMSIYGSTFADENFTVKHSKRGLLSMANRGPNTGSSQFFITFAATPWLDGRHVVFGEVVEGLDILDKLEAEGSRSGTPKHKVTIVKSGQL